MKVRMNVEDTALHRRSGLVSLILLSAGLLLSACAGNPESSCSPKPDWISSPDRDGYYVGVGSADSGSRAEDRSVAEARARADLASRISATIRSELEVATSESTAEGASQEVRENVSQSVEANLQDIETVDSYHCPGEGTWVYLRLSKPRWAEIQEERRLDLERRLQKLVEPVFSQEQENLLLQIETLLQARKLVYSSSLGPAVRGELGGREGTLADILGTLINNKLSSLSVSLERNEMRVPAGRELSIAGRLESEEASRIGKIAVEVQRKDGSSYATTQTDDDGFFSLTIAEGFSRPGEQQLVIRPSFSAYEGEGLLPEENLPTAELLISVQRVEVGLVVENSEDARGIDFSRQVKSLFADRDLPLEIRERFGAAGPSLVIRFLIRIEDFPPMSENALKMSQARAIVSFEREGRTLYSYESDPLKDGGINFDQAHQRVSDKLFGELANDEELFGELERAIIER